MKKKLVALTTGAVIASALAANPTNAASYTVKSGDSLWSIAQKHQTSITSLKSINQLKNDLIFPNQVLQLDNTTKRKSTTTSTDTVANKTTNKTYTVKAGDSLSKIAAAHKISLNDLMSWNELTSTLIYPNDVLVVTKPSATSSNTTKPTNQDNVKSEQHGTYKVKAGDSLWKISKQYSMSITKLKEMNALSSDVIQVGQVLTVKATATSAEPKQATATDAVTAKVDYNVDQLLKTAKAFLGTAYIFGGSNPGLGFDCSGFIYYVFNKAGKELSRLSSDGYYNRSYYVHTPQVGDLVFFENTYRKGISHLGIYAGNNTFIHASSKGVQQTSLDNSYWSAHFEGFKRFY